MGPTPVYGARAEKPLQNADFALKQTNICRLSGDAKYANARLVQVLQDFLQVSSQLWMTLNAESNNYTYDVDELWEPKSELDYQLVCVVDDRSNQLVVAALSQ